MVALAAIGALIVGLIAPHFWLAPEVGSLTALGMIPQAAAAGRMKRWLRDVTHKSKLGLVP
jgi:hypothetical protein